MIAGYLSRLKDTLAMLKKEAQLAGLSFPEMLWQTSKFCLKTRLGPRYFVVAGMARKNFKEADKWLHISAREYYNALDKLNPPLYRKLTQSKLSEKALYQLLHIPTAPMLGYFHPVIGVTNSGETLQTADALQHLLQQHAGSTVMVKPLEGFGGSGVMALAISYDGETLQLQSVGEQQLYSAEQLLSAYQRNGLPPEFMLEAYIQQSAQFASFNPSSLNTLRLWVLETAPDQAEVIGGYLRIGRAGKVIDNASAGGIMCPIELAAGELQPGLIKKTPHRDDICQHPDHGAPLAGVILEQWPQIKQFAEKVLLTLPHTRFAGLDITMTGQGPLLIESNVAPDKDGAAHGNIPSVKLQLAARKPYVKHH
ncbi:sugar-transfer associated ATP-grasp domain-containing protein [Arsukibacterium sp.]|uniref:sugar-transfer associated ATP-grasp domain-containing protein n=1 Tax=Arsukibacterium sp. TaxID=1977258 RepID=UPI00299D6436|nr:sugar-transfer associated ATP-grasp domain-containing protein [Arsukibacterium sp.]MDX1538464.1 sugar-transfer associated ATP-grasp domain-containing protein [Arsukibacterium sp.]